MINEMWADVKGFEGLYKISNFGNVFSCRKNGLMRPCPDTRGYLQVILSNNGLVKTTKVHMLVWDAFGDKPRQGRKFNVDHKDECKTNNHIDNLQVLSNRDNKIKSVGKSGRLPGCWLRCDKKKWVAAITLNGKAKHLGNFNTEAEAHIAYLGARKKYAV